MSGQDLYEALKESGTGETKLAILEAALQKKKGLTCAEACKALEDGGAPEGTLKKARDFATAAGMAPPKPADPHAPHAPAQPPKK